MALTREALLAALKPKNQEIQIADIGTVHVAELSISEMDELRTIVAGSPEANSFALHVVVRSVKGEGGESLFTDEDIAELRADSNKGVQALITAALTVNGLIAAEAKNSAETTGAGSVSA